MQICFQDVACSLLVDRKTCRCWFGSSATCWSAPRTSSTENSKDWSNWQEKRLGFVSLSEKKKKHKKQWKPLLPDNRWLFWFALACHDSSGSWRLLTKLQLLVNGQLPFRVAFLCFCPDLVLIFPETPKWCFLSYVCESVDLGRLSTQGYVRPILPCLLSPRFQVRTSPSMWKDSAETGACPSKSSPQPLTWLTSRRTRGFLRFVLSLCPRTSSELKGTNGWVIRGFDVSSRQWVGRKDEKLHAKVLLPKLLVPHNGEEGVEALGVCGWVLALFKLQVHRRTSL